jgi:phosphopantothenoylcysteine decarboxylase/phosphopantothenate--cysteine ligase
VIAPATADVIAKAAVGIADDIVTTVLLATRAKVAFAPAMNVHMYEHPTVVENLGKLRARGAVIIDPAEGALACGYEGKGRLPEPATVVAEIERMLSTQDLAGENVLVTAGPTQEPIDSVRFVTNRSSGKMGFAIARAAWRRGAAVRLVAGPSALATPYGVERIDTVTAAALLAQTAGHFPWSTTLVMAAAVADFRPANPAPGKIKKDARGLRLEMESIADEMPRLAAKKGARILIGFAAETDDLEANARAKLKRKGLDLIVANDVTREGAGFDVDTNIVTLIGSDGSLQSHPQMSKDAVADLILDRIVAIRAGKPKSGRAEKSSRLRAVR